MTVEQLTHILNTTDKTYDVVVSNAEVARVDINDNEKVVNIVTNDNSTDLIKSKLEELIQEAEEKGVKIRVGRGSYYTLNDSHIGYYKKNTTYCDKEHGYSGHF